MVKNRRTPRLRIGLTGGIASGKTQVSDQLGKLDVSIIDTDLIAREVVAKGSQGLKAIQLTFGDDVLDSNGTLNRAHLRKVVFADIAARKKLEAITHPLIQQSCQHQYEQASGLYVVFAVPLLVGSPMRIWMDRVLVVDCSETTQLRRLQSRDGSSWQEARQILDAQSTRTERLAIADDVISNNGSLRALEDSVDRIHHFYVWMSRQ